MYRHQGKRRTMKDNLRIAIILSFVAGIVNVTGFLFLKQLTTNVTGHFALFINDVANFEFWKGTVYFLYIFSFLLGSFISSFLIELFRNNKRLNVYVIPVLIESFILVSVAILASLVIFDYPDLIACLLLFSMGLQNSYVTKVSDAVVRTTHLTGLFTDLGIELSYLFFKRKYSLRDKIKASIRLRVYIISFFFIGGLFGGFVYSTLDFKMYTLIFGAVALIANLLYDGIRFKLISIKRRDFRRKLRMRTD
ncbi:MAG TPA: YoaK family protein [Brumimicrobium sp.]|nr:YoaK family protein [Brumimicrobium sp.]